MNIESVAEILMWLFGCTPMLSGLLILLWEARQHHHKRKSLG